MDSHKTSFDIYLYHHLWQTDTDNSRKNACYDIFTYTEMKRSVD